MRLMCVPVVMYGLGSISQDAMGSQSGSSSSVPFLLSNIAVPDYSSLIGNSVPKWLGLLPIPGACLVSVAGSCRDELIVVVNLLMCSVYKSSLSHATQYPSRTPPNALLLLSSPARPLSSPLIRLLLVHIFKMQFRNLLVALVSLSALVAAAPVVSLESFAPICPRNILIP